MHLKNDNGHFLRYFLDTFMSTLILYMGVDAALGYSLIFVCLNDAMLSKGLKT